ncbi:ArgE/DapE family deacylase [Lentilactobacillus sunkii]|uniref:Probable succinyl-diaminopimelate desuccinylase n=1 Tax=Lentilactobacillus sunkii DSM 19904 TaxID=1423808 RepID=A0A0R1L5S1_9LACO|nr:ArgE/DapE family deacylase [Lentilactobacillus sunkii]KRK87490.1 succinyl-diaminopimelate desuccinylase [Lentilactobacillus sunkii DSM 19904]
MDKKKQIDILSNLISIQSVNDNEARVADYISSLFEPYKNKGVKIERVTYAPKRDNLVVTIGEGKRILGFSGHEDVVDAGDLESWGSDPFVATVRDGKLYGRGATDMKSGLAAVIIAMLDMLEDDSVPRKIKLFATVGEETGEYGAAQLAHEGYADGLDGLIISEPGNAMSEVGFTSKGVIDYIITSIGKGAHSSQPERGINAIDHLIDFANKVKPLMATFDKVDPVLGKLTHVQSIFNGGEQINSVPAKAIMKGNIRTIPEYPNQVIFDALGDLVDKLNRKSGYNLTIEYSFPEEAMPGDENSDFIKLIKKVHDEMFEKPLIANGQTGASDGSEFLHAKGDFSIALLGPGNNTSHQSNEYVEVDVYHKSVEFYKQLAKEFFDQ